jgi:hypothetical protein
MWESIQKREEEQRRREQKEEEMRDMEGKKG